MSDETTINEVSPDTPVQAETANDQTTEGDPNEEPKEAEENEETPETPEDKTTIVQ